MGIMDLIATAPQGGGAANYAKAGRHLIRVTRAHLRENHPELGDGFNLDGSVLATNNPVHKIGDVVRINCIFSVPKTKADNADRMRRILTAAYNSKLLAESKETVTPAYFMGNLPEERAVVEARVQELVGEKQALVGTLIAVSAVERKSEKTGNTFTLYEAFVPTAEDLAAAGL